MTLPPLAGSFAVDVRCLQDRNYAGRGIGRHTLNLLRDAPPRGGSRLVGLVDPALPPLDPAVAALFDAVCPNPHYSACRGLAGLISASPMTHDPIFAAELATDPELLKAAVIYDFIPFDAKARYLAAPAERLAYHACLRWLAGHDLFAPISEASAARLTALLGTPAERIAVTGAALDPVFEPQAGPRPERWAPPAHVLVVGGGDSRKNVECAVRAHAMVAAYQQEWTLLIITGQYDAATLRGFRDLAVACGGQPGLVRAPGHVPEARLVALYRDAECVIAPSRAEGFDLPVVEAMAAGAPVLASDIAVHRELVTDPACRFDPDDPARLAALLGALAGDPAARRRIVAAQATTWPRFRAQAVAARFWRPIADALARAPAAPAVRRGHKPRLALLSPLPPDRSGVADYSAATCSALGALTDLHVFTPTADPAPVHGAATVRPLSAVPSVSAGFDRVVNVMGNSDFHLRIFHQMLRHGGACIAHDSRMLGFYRILLGMDRATAVAARELGRPVTPQDVDGWMADEATLEALHFGEMADVADPMIVHSPVTARAVRERFGITPGVLPFCIYRPFEAEALRDRDAARRRLGLPDGQVVIATFGFVGPTKSPVDCIWALEMLRAWGIDASLHFVGASAGQEALDRLAADLGLTGRVRFLGDYVTDRMYRDYLIGADLGVQLRLTYFGSISGALMDCVGAGLPTVANVSLAEAMDAPDYVRRIPDRLSPVLLAEALADLLDAGLARTRPEAARRDFAEAHSFPVYARGLCGLLGLEVA